jgi:uridine kinase
MQRKPYLVGIAGGSGSGKTTLVRALRDGLPTGTVCLVGQDDYYHPKEAQQLDPNGRVNFDLPTAVDLDGLVRDLRTLLEGGVVVRKEYTFNNAGREASVVELHPAPVILVEGLFVLHHAPLRELFDLRVFIEASEQAQLDRRLLRDAHERGYGAEEVRYQWDHHVLPAYRNYLLPYRHLCDLHVVNESSFERAITVLRNHLAQAAGIAGPVRFQGV